MKNKKWLFAWGVALLISAHSFFVSAQPIARVYQMKMNVLENEQDTSYFTLDTLVVWGTYADTLCFHFMFRNVCFFTMTENVKKEINKKLSHRLKKFIQEQEKAGNIIYILQDEWNKKYIVDFIFNRKQGKFSIWIAEIDYGIPSYFLSLVDY